MVVIIILVIVIVIVIVIVTITVLVMVVILSPSGGRPREVRPCRESTRCETTDCEWGGGAQSPDAERARIRRAARQAKDIELIEHDFWGGVSLCGPDIGCSF